MARLSNGLRRVIEFSETFLPVVAMTDLCIFEGTGVPFSTEFSRERIFSLERLTRNWWHFELFEVKTRIRWCETEVRIIFFISLYEAVKSIIEMKRSSSLFLVQNYLLLLFDKCRVYIRRVYLRYARIFIRELGVIGRDRCFCFEGERDVASSV